MLILTQRLAIPLGGSAQLPATVPVLLGLVAWGLLRGHLAFSRSRAVLLGGGLAALALLTLVSLMRGQDPSALSLLLFVLIYLPALAVSTSDAASKYALRFFVDLMLLAAVVGLSLFVLQFAGVSYADHLASVVPKQFLLTGYNVTNPIAFDSAIYRSNGVVFAEPSFFSLFLGLAAMVSLSSRHRRGWLWLLLAALLSTEAGNGVVLILASTVWLLVLGPGRRRLLALVAPVLVAVVFAALTPLGGVFWSRVSEVGTQNSSSSLRLVQPYQQLIPAYLSSAPSALAGNGAGSAQRYVEDVNGDVGVIVPVVPKLLFEYGVLGTLAAGGFLAFLFVADGRRVPWFAGLLVVYLLINASLLQTTLAASAWLFLSTLAPRPITPRGSRADPDERHGPAPTTRARG